MSEQDTQIHHQPRIKMPSNAQLLCISALCPKDDLPMHALTREIKTRDCEIQEFRAAQMASGFCITMSVVGNWSAIGRLETALPSLAEQFGIRLTSHRSEHETGSTDARPYAAEVIAPRQPELMHVILSFFHDQDIQIREAIMQHYESSYTGTAMCSMHLVVHVPVTQHPQALREAFLDLCDEHHADGLFDPLKS